VDPREERQGWGAAVLRPDDEGLQREAPATDANVREVEPAHTRGRTQRQLLEPEPFRERRHGPKSASTSGIAM
jgi:hypothetical protein